MQYADTVVVPVRLSKLTVELADQQAKSRRMSRSTWMRETIMLAIQQQQQSTDLKLQLDAVVKQINAHITAEINTLTQG